MKDKLTGKLYPSYDNSDQPYQTLGILTSKPIPNTKVCASLSYLCLIQLDLHKQLL